MSDYRVERPFDTIESAYEFMDILADTVLDAIKDLHLELAAAVEAGQDRKAKAIELALFKTKTLNCYVHKSRRTLNDLRTLRRLILDGRAAPEAVVAFAQAL